MLFKRLLGRDLLKKFALPCTVTPPAFLMVRVIGDRAESNGLAFPGCRRFAVHQSERTRSDAWAFVPVIAKYLAFAAHQRFHRVVG
jgi:hypothetical protein